jgi:hypothetical protein
MALSFLRIEHDAVVFRRWPRRKLGVTRRDIDRFAVLKQGKEGGVAPLIWLGRLTWPREQYDYVVLVMKNGSSVRVPSKGSEPAVLALRLNNELLKSL